jgi:hypothetical protein
MNDDIQAVPELLPQRKKGSVWVNVIIRILNKRSPISSDNRDNTSNFETFSAGFRISTFSAISIFSNPLNFLGLV